MNSSSCATIEMFLSQKYSIHISITSGRPLVPKLCARFQRCRKAFPEYKPLGLATLLPTLDLVEYDISPETRSWAGGHKIPAYKRVPAFIWLQPPGAHPRSCFDSLDLHKISKRLSQFQTHSQGLTLRSCDWNWVPLLWYYNFRTDRKGKKNLFRKENWIKH